MQRSAWKWIGLAFLGLAAGTFGACSEEGVGDPCTPETIPQKNTGGMIEIGFVKSESYIESSSVQCRSRLCIVHQLDNGQNTPADPNNICIGPNNPPNCTPEAAVLNSVYCTCKCGGPKTAEQCECPDGFSCKEILTLGGDGIKGSYCVKPKPAMPGTM